MRGLRYHIDHTHVAEGVARKYKCPHCDKVLTGIKRFRNHITAKHPMEDDVHEDQVRATFKLLPCDAHSLDCAQWWIHKVPLNPPFSLLTKLTVLTLQIVASFVTTWSLCWSSGPLLAS